MGKKKPTKPTKPTKTTGRAKVQPGDLPTERQAHVYKLIVKYFAEYGYPPTFLEVAQLDGKTAPGAVAPLMRALHRRGLIVLPKGRRARAIAVPAVRDAVKAMAGRLLAEVRSEGMKTKRVRSNKPVQPGDPPTPLQARAYRLVLKHFAETGQPPTPEEMLGPEKGFRSTAAVSSHLKWLHKRGLIVWDEPTTTRARTRRLEIPKLRAAAQAAAARLLVERR